jgi:hypothetical protein
MQNDTVGTGFPTPRLKEQAPVIHRENQRFGFSASAVLA